MITHGFTLQIDGVAYAEFEAFSEAMCGAAHDCTPSFRSGVAYVGFDRDAQTLRDAVASAIESVHRADPSVTVVGVVLDDGRPIDAAFAASA